MGKTRRSPLVTRRIRDLAEYIKFTLYEFLQKYDISIMVIENALSIPMHVPLGVAITELLSESQIPAIAHHHDLYWERVRFSVNAIPDLLEMAFPPRSPDMQHVVINQQAQEELSWRKGLASLLVPNVIDFEKPPPAMDAYSRDVRREIGLGDDDIMILQPTRVVPRKGIEHAIQLLHMLGDSRYKLVVSHDAGDEGFEYVRSLSDLAEESNVDVRFISTRVGEYRQLNQEGRKVYTLWDLYPHADLVTYRACTRGSEMRFSKRYISASPC